MKKLIVILPILVVIAAVIFYFGWIQIQLPENTYAVIFTKTRGWDQQTTEPGRFTWRWERLVPTNLTLHRYTIEPQTTVFRYEGELPSGSLYAEGIDPRPDFGYEVSFSISFTLDPDALAQLAADQKITPELLPEYYDRVSTAIATRATSILNTLAQSEDYATMLATVSPEIAEIMIERIAPQFPELELHRVLPRSVSLPDVELYQMAKEQFLTVARSREQARIDRMAETVHTDTRVEQHFRVLERYGALLSDYPVLLELFNLKEGNLDEILNEIESLELNTLPTS